MKPRLIGSLLVLVAVLARAHGPYDSSAQLLLLSEAVEFRATLGMEGARQLLLNAGMSEAEATSALTVRGPSSLVTLPVAVAQHVVELTAGQQRFEPTHLRVATDGLEASFTASYAGAHAGALSVRARYFQGIDALKPGAFVVLDENHNIKFQDVFSSTKVAAEIHLAGQVTAEPPGKESATNMAPTRDHGSSVASNVAVRSESSKPQERWVIGAILVVGLSWVVLRALNRSR